MIRRAKIPEINDILIITKACADFMIKNGIFQWNEQYPNKSVFENDIQRDELFIKIDKDRIIGAIVISQFMDEEYRSVSWLTPNHKNIYIHRLCVHPNEQRKGHARQMMDFAEDHARKNRFISVRLDTFSQNKSNQKFYEGRGYQKLSNIFFPKQSTYPFHCYELVL